MLMMAGLSIAGLTACGDIGLDQFDDTPFPIPAGSIVYTFKSTLLRYNRLDSSIVPVEELTWLPTEPFSGFNCIGLLPGASGDSSGTFAFSHGGLNVGRMLRRLGTTTDTVAGLLLTGFEGNHGTYLIQPSGSLSLVFADAQTGSRQFFGPDAVIRLAGDTIASDVNVSASGGLETLLWSVRWLRGTC